MGWVSFGWPLSVLMQWSGLIVDGGTRLAAWSLLSLDKLWLRVLSWCGVVFCKLAICWPIGAPGSTYFGAEGTNIRRLSCLLVQRGRETQYTGKSLSCLLRFSFCTTAFDFLSALHFIEWIVRGETRSICRQIMLENSKPCLSTRWINATTLLLSSWFETCLMTIKRQALLVTSSKMYTRTQTPT